MEVLYETKRLIVRKWEETDAEDLYDYAKNPDVSKFLKFKPYTSIKEADERIANILTKYNNGDIEVPYAIVLKDENKVIGSIDIELYSDKAEGIIEIGYILSKDYQGNGYMTEALKGMFKYIKQKNIAKRIFCKHDTENIKSRNVMKRAGMTFEGVLRKAGDYNNTHSRYDFAIYSILFEEIDLNEENIESKKVVIFTDGACSGNPGVGGWGAILFFNGNKKEISGFEIDTTNNKMELTAAIMALEKLKEPCEVELYSDSAYLINAFNEDWITKWQMNGFKTANKKEVANIDLWQKLIDFNSIHKIKWIKVKGHSDNEFNNRCDELATGEIAKHQ